MWVYFSILAVIVSAMLYVVVEERIQKKKRRTCFAHRPVQDPEKWYAEFYGLKAYDKEIVFQVCTLLSKEVGVHLSQIYPTDRFDTELRLEGVWQGDTLGTLEDWIEKRAKKFKFSCKIPELNSVKTVDDLLQLLSTKLTKNT